MNRFCGFPTGVRALPTFAATVCRTTVMRIGFCSLQRENTTIVSGTKVIRATSLVIAIELKNVRPTKREETCLGVWAKRKSTVETLVKKYMFRNPATTSISAKRQPSTFQSI